MIRALISIAIAICAIFWLPLWAQFAIFGILIIITPYRFLLLLPAIVADALYAPSGTSITHAKYTIFVFVLLLLWWVITTKTRLREVYVLEKK
jgi:hypothetical protein